MRFFLVLFLAVSSSAFSVTLETGSDLLSACSEATKAIKSESADLSHATACLQFLNGFDSGQSVMSNLRQVDGVHCAPSGLKMIDMAEAIVTGLEAKPEALNFPAGIAAWQVLAARWPCD